MINPAIPPTAPPTIGPVGVLGEATTLGLADEVEECEPETAEVVVDEAADCVLETVDAIFAEEDEEEGHPSG
jgi:hypothetical protein